MGAMPVGCYKQMSVIKEGVIMRLQCIYIYNLLYIYIVVPSHRTDWGLRAFAVAGPSCWNELLVELRDLTVGPETFAKHLKTHLFIQSWFFLMEHALLSLCNIL